MFGKNFGYCAVFALTVSQLASAESMLIDDFSSNPQARWQYVSDQVMGGVSKGAVEYKKQDDVFYAALVGEVSTENNGGFIQIRTRVDKVQVAEVKAVHIRARGNNQRYFIHLRTTGTLLPWQYYQVSFEVSEQWQDFMLPLEQFSRSGNWLSRRIQPQTIRSIGVVAYGRDHQAEIEIAQIGFH